MAKHLFFTDFPDGSFAMTVDRADWDHGAHKLPRIWTKERGWTRCTRVVRKANPSNYKCDSRCLNATGRTMQCECSCGGKNHGKGSFACEAA